MSAAIDITGMRSGSLVAIEPSAERKHRKILWRCQCDCGGERLCLASAIRVGDNTFCATDCSAKPLPNSHIRSFIEAHQGYDGCWEWDGAQDADGYCHTKLSGERMPAHRAVYRFANGEIPAGLNICHSCDNPPCCNPEHLFSGTQKQNCDDAKSKDRHSRGTRNGVSKLTDDNVRFIRANSGILKQTEMAEMFDVRQSTVWVIIQRRAWKHVQD